MMLAVRKERGRDGEAKDSRVGAEKSIIILRTHMKVCMF